MSRVEDNEKVMNNIITSLNTVGENGMTALTITQPDIANAIMNHAKTDILVDISRSLAVIADNVADEKAYSKAINLIEDKLLRDNRITEKEWDIWVYIKEKYILGKKSESSDDIWDAIQNLHVPVKGTNRICGFCNNSYFTDTTLDSAVCHCALHNLDVAFTCSACDSFDDVRSDMTFEEFTKKWKSYFDEDELGELKKSWIKGLWNGEPMTLREKYGDILDE